MPGWYRNPQSLLIHGSTILNSTGILFAPFPGFGWVHTLLPYHSFKLSTNTFAHRALHSLDAICGYFTHPFPMPCVSDTTKEAGPIR